MAENHVSDYEAAKEAAVAEVVRAYVEGAPDVRGGLGNVLMNLGRHIDCAADRADFDRLHDAIGKLAKLYEGPR